MNELFWKSIWERLKAVTSWAVNKFLAPGVALLVVIFGVILVSMGAKELQIGGILRRLLGRKGERGKALDVANTVDPQRIDSQGRIINPGTPDAKGFQQAVIVPIHDPGLFSDPSTVTFIPPGEKKPVVIDLPEGVTNKDVDKVIVMKPSVFAVTVKDGSGVPASRVEDLLSKYGS
jgi:hypothetical protein